MRSRFLFMLLLVSVSMAIDVPDVKLSILSTPASATPGSSFTVQVQGVNGGAGIARLVRIYPDVSGPFSIKAGTNSEILVDELRYGSNLITDFGFVVSPNALSDTYKLKIFLEYRDQNNNTGRVSQEVAINVAGTPLLELTDVGMPETILPGSTANLGISVRNIGTANARNVRIMFANISDPSIKPSGNPVAYIENAPAGSEKSFSLSFSADGKAGAKPYLLPIIIAYQDNNGKDYSLQRFASVNVGSEIVLQAFASNQDPLVAGTPGTVSVTVANVGPHDSEFLSLEALDAGVYPRNTYLGTLESNDYSTVDLKLTPQSAGAKDLRVRLIYRDGYNREYVLDRNVSYSVISAQDFAKEQPKSSSSYFLPALVVLVLLYVVFKRRNKK